MNIKIIVATHKEYPMPEDSMYLPLHVGKACATAALAFPGDNTGEHISSKNPSYCELTALYWAWKNCSADYIGLAHYRRHFTTKKPPFFIKNKFPHILTKNEAEKLLETSDILLPKKRNYYIETNYSHYIHAHPAESIDKTGEIIHTLCPQYDEAFQIVMKRRKAHMFNMLIMKKDYLNNYCQWLFPILGQLEQVLDTSTYDSYNQRIYGFVSELLLDVYLTANNLCYKELPVMFMENEHWLKKGLAFLKRKFFPM